MGRQRQLPVYDNTEVASCIRDGDASTEHQDVVAVDPVHKLNRAEPEQLCLHRVQPTSARTQPGVDVRDTCSELVNCYRVSYYTTTSIFRDCMTYSAFRYLAALMFKMFGA